MRAQDVDLLAGALTLAYKYADLRALLAAYRQLEAGESDDGGLGALDLPGVLEAAGELNSERATKLRTASRLVAQLRIDAVYGMIAVRNNLVPGEALNTSMEEAKHTGYEKTLPAVLVGRGLLTPELDEVISGRRDEILPGLLAKESELAGLIDLEHDPRAEAELKLGMLLGEVAATVAFLPRSELEQALEAREQKPHGLSSSIVAAASPGVVAAAREAHRPPGAPPSPTGPAAGSSSAPPPPTEEVEPIQGYELLLKLGQGAMGAVLKARKRDTGEVVALKILKPELARDPEYVERFLREAKAVARLSHPNIIRAVQTGKSNDYYFFAMEFVEGQTASELLDLKGRLPERFCVMLTRCVAAALGHAWRYQIIHRDIKPDNVMITGDGGVKLTDLGLARSVSRASTLTMTGVVVGSPAYISPEQATGNKDLDIRSDIYSLGATLFHLLAGKVPYPGETPLHVMLRHMNDPVPDVGEINPGVSEATRALIMRMMAKRPEERLQTPTEVEHAALAIEEALARGAAPPLPPNSAHLLRAQAPQPPRPPAPATPAAPAAPGAAPPSAGVQVSREEETEHEGLDLAPLPEPSPSEAQARGRAKADKKKEVGERLRRLAGRRKRRF